MNIFGVSTKKLEDLKLKMQYLGVSEKDILEKFIRSQGKGGQNVNKTSTQVYLKYLPTGLEIKCQIDRSQPLNRFLARRLLVEKLEADLLGKRSEKIQQIEKLRRQKRRRSRRAKNKMLDNKRAVSERKDLRKRVEF